MTTQEALLTFYNCLKNTNKDDPIYNELQQLRGNRQEIEKRFSKFLPFGTGGLRGIMGAGLDRMNSYVVRRASFGLAQYILQNSPNRKPSVVIAYDTRENSSFFAFEAAKVIAGQGIYVYLFDSFWPTPLLSFAVRHLQASAGVMITASHNPAVYNGYKIYGPDGGQAIPSLANQISKFIQAIPPSMDIPLQDFDVLQKAGLITMIGEEIDRAYVNCYRVYDVFNRLPARTPKMPTIVYTPLHGTGGPVVKRILNAYEIDNVFFLPEQEVPDGRFPTLDSLNPEEEAAFKMAKEYAQNIEADLIIATDPDCDRVGVMVKDAEEKYRLLNGNQLGVLLLDYILTVLKETNHLPLERGTVITTVVSSDLGSLLCQDYGLFTRRTLTGFKYIGEQIELIEKSREAHFIFGYEESGGYLAAPFVRDKDGVMGVLLVCQMAAHYYGQGKTLIRVLEDIYKKYGYFSEKLISLSNPKEIEQIMKLMEQWRKLMPFTIARYNIIHVEDYLHGNTGLPPENAIKITLDNQSWICVRPSGTEPKVKIYICARARSAQEAETIAHELEEWIRDRTK